MSLPDKLGRYEIQSRLGAGAMGEVFIARDPQIERLCALKTLKIEGVPEKERSMLRDRLLFEAKAAGQLVHPNVVTLFDTGEDDGVVYLAFEYVDGCHLGERMAREPKLTLGEVLRITREVASALDAAQTRGVVHRDIKPSNILIDRSGTAKVADFGIAKMRDRASDLTVTGAIIGTPHYMSPEQIRADSLDGRSDVFSLGAVLFELLHRSRPFRGDTITTLVYQILHHDPVPQVRPDLPDGLRELLRGMLEKEVEQRPWAGDVVRALDRLLRELPSALHDTPVAQRPFPPADDPALAASRESAVPSVPGSEGEKKYEPSGDTGQDRQVSPPPPPGSPSEARGSGGGEVRPSTPPLAHTTPLEASDERAAMGQMPDPAASSRSEGSSLRPGWIVAGCAGLAALVLLVGIFALAGRVERWLRGAESPSADEQVAEAEVGTGVDRGEPASTPSVPAQGEVADADGAGAEDEAPVAGVSEEPEASGRSERTHRAASETPTTPGPDAGQRSAASDPRQVSGGAGQSAGERRVGSESATSTRAAAARQRVAEPADEPVDAPVSSSTRAAARDTGGAQERREELATPGSVQRTPDGSASAFSSPAVEPEADIAASERPDSAIENRAPTPVAPDQVLRTSRVLSFDVAPEDAYILFRRPTERRFVQIGQAKDYDASKRRGRTWSLPGTGAFELIVRAPRHRDHLIALEAGPGGTTTIRVRLEPGQPGGASPP